MLPSCLDLNARVTISFLLMEVKQGELTAEFGKSLRSVS